MLLSSLTHQSSHAEKWSLRGDGYVRNVCPAWVSVRSSIPEKITLYYQKESTQYCQALNVCLTNCKRINSNLHPEHKVTSVQ